MAPGELILAEPHPSAISSAVPALQRLDHVVHLITKMLFKKTCAQTCLLPFFDS
jgi:hypothetical protein